jgi:hypothetical protein
MAAQDEKRAFSEGEAASLRRLLDVLSMYCAESVVWWEEGKGIPVKQDAKPAAPPQPEKKPETEPKPQLFPGMLVADSGSD